MAKSRKPWSEQECSLLRSIWNTDIKVESLGEYFPGRTPSAIYSQGAKILKLGKRRVKQDFDAFLSWKKLEAQLAIGPKTAKQMAKCTGLKHDKILCLLNNRHGRLVRIDGYTIPTRGGRQMIWALGIGPDAEKPPTLTHAEVARRYRNKLKAEKPEEYEAYQKRRKFREKLNSGAIPPRRDIAASWF